MVASKVKEAVKDLGYQSSGDLVEALSDMVHDKLQAAVLRAKENKRATVRRHDL